MGHFLSNVLLVRRYVLQELVLPSGVNKDPFALLLSRGNCSFERKALAAQQAGATALIIYNSLEVSHHGNRGWQHIHDKTLMANGVSYTNRVSTSTAAQLLRSKIMNAVMAKLG